MTVEPQYRSLIVGLVPKPRPGPYGFGTEALHDVYRAITPDYPYAEFRFLGGGIGAQLSNGPQEFVTLDPGLIQVRTEIVLTPATAQTRAIAILERATRRLEQHEFTQCGIQVNAHAPIPDDAPGARVLVTDTLMGAQAQVNMLGHGFFGCLRFRRAASTVDEQLSIEPLLTDDQFVFVSLDVQRAGPQAGLDEVAEWLESAFDFLRTHAVRLLEGDLSLGQP